MWELACLVDLGERLARGRVGIGKFGGLGRKAKQTKVLYLCRKDGPRPGGNGQVWWTWAMGQNKRKCCTYAEKMARGRVGMGKFGGLGRRAKQTKVLYLGTQVARGKANNARKSRQAGPQKLAKALCAKVARGKANNTKKVGKLDRRNLRKCCTCEQKWPGARPTTHEK